MKLREFLGLGPRKGTPPAAPERSRADIPPKLPPGVRTVDQTTLLRGIPALHPQVTRVSDRRFGCMLTWPAVRPGTRQRKTRLGRFLAGPVRRNRLVLDDLGRRTVELIDGNRPLSAIAATMARQTGHAPHDMEKAVLTFIGNLARRNIVILKAPEPGTPQ